MTEFEPSHTGKEPQSRGGGFRWLVSFVLIVALTGATVAAMQWNQSIRTFLDRYLADDVAQETTVEQEDSLQVNREVLEPTESSGLEGLNETGDTTADTIDLQDAFDVQKVDVPITITRRDPFAQVDSIDVVRRELRNALVSVTGNVDLVLAEDALQRALNVAHTERSNQTVIGSLEQALAEIDRIEDLNIASIRMRIDDISKLVVLLTSEGSTIRPNIETDSTFDIEEPPESQGFWGELADGVTDVYRVRRIDDPTIPAADVDLDRGELLRVLVLLERARYEIWLLDFDSYRTSLREAITLLDSLNQEDTGEWRTVRDELFELTSLELTSPRQAIRTALSALTNAPSTLVDETVVQER